MEEPISCPFCGHETNTDYLIMLHLEMFHPEGGDPSFVVKDDASIAAVLSIQDDMQYVSCPAEGCSEVIPLKALDSHINMHGAEYPSEKEGNDEDARPRSKRKRTDSPGGTFGKRLSQAFECLDDGERVKYEESDDQHAGQKAVWKNILNMRSPNAQTKNGAKTVMTPKESQRRLGRKELGPHAHEEKMPASLVKILAGDGETIMSNRKDANGKMRRVKICPNRTEGILPVVEQLLEQDRSVSFAYLCHPAVRHVSKLKKEGGFCGYRNIQMLCSYINTVKSQGHENLQDKIPSIFDIQEYIETAWDLGINSGGRAETGGIRGTRKYIGTPDAQAMCFSLGISCDAQAFKSTKNGPKAIDLLLDSVEAYFLGGATNLNPKIRRTSLPPLYFQHPGHSMTIAGFEKRRDGTRNLLCFDPIFHDSVQVTQKIGQTFECKSPADLLKAYRREAKYLRRHSEFEILK
ncbi:peptidase family C78-domain-containing protein [Calycina marina]|uniref:Peptidase family C78-domain-containing protein n=1 Tax=Calycina marina TaxID=1763456 RepID=A0A9P7Z949_9HELO|nr:peptidase family C78-domain-containing protein [Calycina marina]